MSNKYDTEIVLDKMAARIDILPEEMRAVRRRLDALATATKPPVWGYAGLLLTMAEEGRILDAYDVYATMATWRQVPTYAASMFDLWHREQLEAQ